MILLYALIIYNLWAYGFLVTIGIVQGDALKYIREENHD